MTAVSSFGTAESQLRHASFPSVRGKHWTAALDYVTGPVSESPKNRMPSRLLFPKRRARFPFVIGDELSGILLQRHSASGLPKFCYTASMKSLILKNWRGDGRGQLGIDHDRL